MRKFILKTSWFLLPIVVLHLFAYTFYSTKNGDLLRMGYIINLYPHYRTIFSKAYDTKIRYSLISDQPQSRSFKFVTLGDSFSEQKETGYQNYLAQETTLLHMDRFLSKNQIETLYGMLHGDFFEKYSIKYVILQNVERHFIDNIEKIDTTKIITCKDLNDLSNKKQEILGKLEKQEKETQSFKFPSNTILKFPYYTFEYAFKNTFLFDGKVYKTAVSQRFFSVPNQELLFYYYDILATNQNNVEANVYQLNQVLNHLSNLLNKKGVQLVVLPSPDKYDVYYDYIVAKGRFPEPLFFEHLQKMPKNYIYIDSKEILSKALNHKKDLFYYDDTHWSPWASQLIAQAIQKQIAFPKK